MKTKIRNATQLGAISQKPDAKGAVRYQTMLGFFRTGFINFSAIDEDGEVELTDSETKKTTIVAYSISDDFFIER